MMNGRFFFWSSRENDLRTYDIIRKIETGQVDDFTTRYLIDYPYFVKYCRLITIDLRKQQKLDADPKAIEQIDFMGNLEEDNATIFFIIEKAKESILDFSQGTVRVLKYCFVLI